MAVATRKVFINAAVDEHLAQDIFQRTLAAQAATTRATLPPKFSCIALWVDTTRVRNHLGTDGDFEGLLRWIGKGWICRPKPSDAQQIEISLTETYKRALRRWDTISNYMDKLFGSKV
jgi:hypothetical protein